MLASKRTKNTKNKMSAYTLASSPDLLACLGTRLHIHMYSKKIKNSYIYLFNFNTIKF